MLGFKRHSHGRPQKCFQGGKVTILLIFFSFFYLFHLAKRKYYEEQFAQNSRNSKRTWKLNNDVFSTTKPFSFPQRLKFHGRVYSSTILIADALNHSFATWAQTNLTPNSPSKTTDRNIKKNSNGLAKRKQTLTEYFQNKIYVDHKQTCEH